MHNVDHTAGLIITIGAATWLVISAIVFAALNRSASRIEIERIED